ncbi:MAG TPA: alanine--tRNA ligase [Anaerolineae bacterium]|nr:alanine--tRNA ligase [Anaerolineae bacterium]
MPPKTSEAIREAFLRYFEEQGHTRVPSSSLVPHNDPTLLLTNAGMVQFKDVFLGLEQRPYKRATTCQKCMRVSGKHNDLENVGPSPRHHTFFEMLGNFSFGDYFKEGAIRYAYEFLVDRMGLDPDRLYYTVHVSDDEAFDIWTKQMGIAPERVYRMGDKTNFWAMGDVGPCGPTSEIHYDWGPEACTCGDPNCSVALDNGCDRWLEIWNLVFMQFNQDANGVRTPLPKPGVDTGMGLERIVSVVQNTPVNYETDLFLPIMDRVQELTGHTDAQREAHIVSYRVIADHSRAAAFLIADGVRPGPAGRGYVLRMVIRRAHRFGRKIGLTDPFLAQVTDAVVDKMGEVYPELVERQELIRRTVTLEEEQFIHTLGRALQILDEALAELQAKGEQVLPGKVAFDLKSTYGLPFEVTRDICNERGFEVDEEGYREADRIHREKSQGKISQAQYAVGAEFYAALLPNLEGKGLLPPEGVLYDPYTSTTRRTRIAAIIKDGELVDQAQAGEQVEIVLAETPFYVEAGGQVSDTGVIEGPQGRAQVKDVRRPVSNMIVHEAVIESGELRVDDEVTAAVDEERRWDIMRNHTATHLLHRALRMHLGEHVHQAGSLVAPDRLRFDFTYDRPLTEEDIKKIEETVNEAILADYPVHIQHKSLDEALSEGAMALFGEKYGDVVRTVSLGDERFHSYELCGGTHVQRTAEIGPFLIVSEGSTGRGVRRIEALTGREAVRYIEERLDILNRVARILNTPVDNLVQKVADLKDQVSELQREVQRLRQRMLSQQAQAMVDAAREVAGLKVLALRVDATNVDEMRRLADDLRNKLGSGVVILGAVINDKPMLIAAATPDVVEKGVHAGNIVKALAPIIGGGGGGRPNMAQAGGRDASKLQDALDVAYDVVAEQLKS